MNIQSAGRAAHERRGGLAPLESPLQRFQRLQGEVKELHDDLASLAEKNTGGGASGEAALSHPHSPWAHIATGLDQLQGQLGSMKANAAYVPFLDPDNESIQSLRAQKDLSQGLLATLEKLGANGANDGSADGTAGSASADGTDGIVYELYASSGDGAAASSSAGGQAGGAGGGGGSGASRGLSLAEAESRIARLEAVLGSSGDSSMAGSVAGTVGTERAGQPNGVRSVFEELDELDTRLAMLTPQRIAGVGRQVTVLLKEMQALEGAKGEGEEEGGAKGPGCTASEVHALFEMAQRWDAVAQVRGTWGRTERCAERVL